MPFMDSTASRGQSKVPEGTQKEEGMGLGQGPTYVCLRWAWTSVLDPSEKEPGIYFGTLYLAS